MTQTIWSIPGRTQKGDRNAATMTSSYFFENMEGMNLLSWTSILSAITSEPRKMQYYWFRVVSVTEIFHVNLFFTKQFLKD